MNIKVFDMISISCNAWMVGRRRHAEHGEWSVLMYLITGATGLIGRALVDTLVSAGAEITAVTRHPDGAALPPGVKVVMPEALESVMPEVTAVFVHPRATKDGVDALLASAGRHDVARVVVMSAINADDDPSWQPSRFNGDRNTEVERAVAECGLPWVSVRPCSFAMNTLTMWSGQVARGDTIYAPFGAFAEAVLHERDVAEVIARALADDSLLGRRIPLTGPAALRFDEMVQTIGDTIGRPLRWQEIPAEVAAKAMTQRGLGEQFVNALMDRYAREIDQPVFVSDEVAQILGRPARSFADWVAEHVQAWPQRIALAGTASA
ncbi:SDR family oxidoreductase [Nocardia sp. KC 131]|uniref:SDR family oxidoreductase n=1 Tax=Nocardia arseniciresistens TaxID=3392119 RepID=UPI00398E4A5F